MRAILYRECGGNFKLISGKLERVGNSYFLSSDKGKTKIRPSDEIFYDIWTYNAESNTYRLETVRCRLQNLGQIL